MAASKYKFSVFLFFCEIIIWCDWNEIVLILVNLKERENKVFDSYGNYSRAQVNKLKKDTNIINCLKLKSSCIRMQILIFD